MEPVYDVQKRTLAGAFYSWQKSHTKKIGVERDKFFIESIRGILTLRGHVGVVHKLPQNKNTWNDWKRLNPSKTIALSREICLAIKTITGIDVTPRHVLESEYNSTELAIIAREPTARAISNTANDNCQEQYEVSCGRVAFRRSRTLRVEASWCVGEGRRLPQKHAVREIGSAIIGLRRADIQIDANGPISPIVTLISPDKNDPYARAEGVRISDDPVRAGRWVVECGNGEVLVGSVDLSRLASAYHEPENEMQLTVEADKNDFEIDFRPLGEWPEKVGEDESRSNMRRHFIANILRLGLAKNERAYLLSRAPIKT